MRVRSPRPGTSYRIIQQAGCTGVVSALHQIPVGEVWLAAEIQRAARWQLIGGQPGLT